MNTKIEYCPPFKKRQKMFAPLSKYDHTVLSIPHPSVDIHPLFSKKLKADSGKKISAEKILEIQLHSLSRLYAENIQYKTIGETSAWIAITNQLQWFFKEREIVNYFADHNLHLTTLRIQKMHGSINANEIIAVSCLQRDFTPWNLNTDESRLYRYSWEVSNCGIPVLTDLFHSFFLRCTLFKNKNFKEISKEIQEALNHVESKKIIEQYKINTQLHYKLYLLFSISHYLRLYINERFPVVQLHKLVDIWNEALLELA